MLLPTIQTLGGAVVGALSAYLVQRRTQDRDIAAQAAARKEDREEARKQREEERLERDRERQREVAQREEDAQRDEAAKVEARREQHVAEVRAALEELQRAVTTAITYREMGTFAAPDLQGAVETARLAAIQLQTFLPRPDARFSGAGAVWASLDREVNLLADNDAYEHGESAQHALVEVAHLVRDELYGPQD